MEAHPSLKHDGNYTQIEAISRTELSALARGATPRHIKHHRDHPKPPTEAQLFGIAFHAWVLEHETFDSRFAFEPERMPSRRSKVGKLAWESWAAEQGDKTILPARYKLQIKSMAGAVLQHEEASRLLFEDTFARELTVTWGLDIGERKAPCKARLDVLRTDNTVVDIKTCLSAGREPFSRAILQHRYHDQAYWYLFAASRLSMWDPSLERRFVFVAVEKEPPYVVAVYEMADEAIEVAARELEPHIQTLADCFARDQWPGHPVIDTISLPEWRMRQEITSEDIWNT